MSKFTKTLIASLVLSYGVAQADDNGVPLHGFADFKFGDSSQYTPAVQKLDGARFGNIDFYLTARI